MQNEEAKLVKEQSDRSTLEKDQKNDQMIQR